MGVSLSRPVGASQPPVQAASPVGDLDASTRKDKLFRHEHMPVMTTPQQDFGYVCRAIDDDQGRGILCLDRRVNTTALTIDQVAGDDLHGLSTA
jgi:hypothetical protein